MKKTLLTIIGIIAIGAFSSLAFAQDFDTLDIPLGDFETQDSLQKFIQADHDTLTYDHRVYRLKRGGLYLIEATIIINNHHVPLRFCATKEPADSAPPVIMANVDAAGTPPIKLFIVKSSMYADGIYFTGISIKGTTINQSPITIKGDNKHYVFNDCYFSYANKQYILEVGTARNNYFITNCEIRNMLNPGGSTAPWRPFLKSAKTKLQDTIYFENNTFFNIGYAAYANDLYPSTPNYFYWNHNTHVNHGKQVFRNHYMIKGVITNNIFFNPITTGDNVLNRIQDADLLPFAVIQVDTIHDGAGSNPADREITVSSNAWYVMEDIRQFHIDSSLTDPPSHFPIAFMDTARTLAMFNDDATYPNMHFDPAKLYYEDPGFMQYLPQDQHDSLLLWSRLKGSPPFVDPSPDWIWDTDGNVLTIDWPVPENLRYTNTSLQNAGDDGYPLGDLNWFGEDVMNAWLAGETCPPITTIRKIQAVDMGLAIYPNPLNDHGIIGFELKKSAKVSIRLYNIAGKYVETVLSKNLPAGVHELPFNASHLDSGIYFYQLQTPYAIQARKVVVMR